MDFFKSVFADDPEETSDSETTNSQPQPSPSPNPSPQITSVTTAWSFGSRLIKTLASKSESVIETYRRDLEEFSSGLKKETAVIREAASRAVKDLPTSLEAGAAVAQESLESVGQAIDNLGTSVGEIIAHGKDSILADDYSDSEVSDSKQISSSYNGDGASLTSKPYSRLDAQIRMLQCDMNSYLEEVEDLGDYNEWKFGFILDDKAEEIEDLIGGNGVIEEIYNEIVPGRVDEEVFWSRYFYKVYKVKKAEEARANIVKRAIAGEEEDELSWDVDEDEYEESGGSKLEGKVEENIPEKAKAEIETEVESLRKGNDEKVGVYVSGSGDVFDQRGDSESRLDEAESNVDNSEAKSDEKMTSEGKTDKDSDFSVVSSQPSREEEDLGWDEIEDIGDETKVASRGSPDKADLRKRLSAAEDEEDLTWDIEDDDEPVRS